MLKQKELGIAPKAGTRQPSTSTASKRSFITPNPLDESLASVVPSRRTNKSISISVAAKKSYLTLKSP